MHYAYISNCNCNYQYKIPKNYSVEDSYVYTSVFNAMLLSKGREYELVILTFLMSLYCQTL